MQAEYREVWEPFFETSQYYAYYLPVDHIFFTGTRGPGKTDTQLMRFRRKVGLGYGHFWKGVIFDREYKNLGDIIGKSKRWFPQFNDGAEFKESTSALKWVWPTGEELLFRTVKRVDDYWAYHGHEYAFIGWNELCKYPTPDLYQKMMSVNRTSFVPEADTPTEPLYIRVKIKDKVTGKEEIKLWCVHDRDKGILLPKIPLEVFSTGNPYGPGHNWVKRKFITPAPFGEVVRTRAMVFNPATQVEEEVTKTQIALHGNWKENPKLSPEYILELMQNTNEAERKAWLNGDWDIVAGGAIDDVWDKKVHVVPRFRVPASWHVDRAFDWGSTHPFSVGWWAEANGEEAELPDGSSFCPPPGTLIQLGEWYGAKEIGLNAGLKMSGGDIAIGIREREINLMAAGYIAGKPWSGPADNQIRDVRESDVDTIEGKMGKEGVTWEKSDKSPGSRRNGLQLFRDRLEAAKRGEGKPGVYFMENCRASIDILPTLPRDEKVPDDVDTTSEDHVWDMTRYRVLKGANRLARAFKFGFATG